jgi:uncharacterized metal-binding protein YceD (DUF177 family)
MSFEIDDLTIEFVKLPNGNHQFKYQLNGSFFEFFKNTEVLSAEFSVLISLDKTESMIVAKVHSKGELEFTCDRCLKNINLPTTTDFTAIYHLNAEETKHLEAENVNMDIFYLSPAEFTLDFSKIIYESFLPVIPMVKSCDDLEIKPCDLIVLDKIGFHKDEDENAIDPRWEKLKDIFNKKEE